MNPRTNADADTYQIGQELNLPNIYCSRLID